MSRFALAAAALAVSIGCRAQPAAGRDGGEDRLLAELATKRQGRERELKAMSVPALATQLAADSTRGVEPFNSTAYREMVSRGAGAAEGLKSAIAPNASSLLALLALRRVSPNDYRSLDPGVRATVLVSALRASRSFNTWGIPHLFWEDAGKAIVEEGQSIAQPLGTLLDDKRDARVWGSEGAVEAQRYRYRVCDYAWALLNDIRGRRVPIPVDPAERDRLIAASRG